MTAIYMSQTSRLTGLSSGSCTLTFTNHQRYILAMRLKRKPALISASKSTSSPSFFSTVFTKTRNSGITTPTVPCSTAYPTASGIPSDRGSGGNCKSTATTTVSVPTPTGLTPSYLILDEEIPFFDAFRILGRLVANVKCPLEEYTPATVIRGARSPVSISTKAPPCTRGNKIL